MQLQCMTRVAHMKSRYKYLLIAEVILCFAPVVLLWLLGVFALLWQITRMTEVIDVWEQIGFALALIVAGLIGLVAVTYVVAKLLSAASIVERPASALAGLAIGAGALMPPATSNDSLFIVIAALPLLCSVHLVYLARRLLVPTWRRTYTAVAHGASLLLTIGIAAAVHRLNEAAANNADQIAKYSPPRAVELSAADRQQLDELTDRIALASRESYDSGDWSKFAALYPAGMLACWNASGEDHRFGFLSRRGIPDSARYQIIDRRDYHDGGSQVLDTDAFDATHVIMIRYETATFEGCELPVQKTWPEEHLYVRRSSSGFELVHPCPARDAIERRNIVQTWPVASRAQAVRLAEAMSEHERNELRALVKQDAFALRASARITERYGASDAQATEVLNAVCNAARASR
jgi:hypothetical protein